MKISIILPSCFRPQLFEQCVKRIKETTQGHDVEIICLIDNDPITRDISLRNNCITDYSEEKRGALYCWNHGLKLSVGEIIVPVGDDALAGDRWLDHALESHREKLNSYGLVGLNDLMLDGNKQLATHFIFDRKFCIDHLGGVIAQPVYNYYCIDSEINDRAKRANCFYWDDRAIMEHLHSANFKRPLDQHDVLRHENNYMETDREIYLHRKSLGFPDNFEPVIK